MRRQALGSPLLGRKSDDRDEEGRFAVNDTVRSSGGLSRSGGSRRAENGLGRGGHRGAGVSQTREALGRGDRQYGNAGADAASTSDQFGQYRLWLAAQNPDIDLYQTDVIWAPQLAAHFVDLTAAAKDIIPQNFPSIIQSQTVNGKLVALPIFTDAPALFYRKDLLEKHGLAVPKTWEELATTAKAVQDAERAEGKADLWGFVWQGNAYEGLTCNALEWIKSMVAGRSSSPMARSPSTMKMPSRRWRRPSPGLERSARRRSRLSGRGGAWPLADGQRRLHAQLALCLYAWQRQRLGREGPVRRRASAGWRRQRRFGRNAWRLERGRLEIQHQAGRCHQPGALPRRPEAQKARALSQSNLPTLVSLYDDPDIAAQQPFMPRWKEVFLQAVPRPSAATLGNYNEVSSKFWSAVHDVLSGNKEAAIALEDLEADLSDLKGDGWK